MAGVCGVHSGVVVAKGAKGAKRAKNEALYGETEDEMNAGTKLRLV
ncbi:unnamed protein product [Penicillium camemberti]|uniref:Str. FM013 n=1 Tax=Penicillium camemberti (strain FM 013) TaxID=1429867 RepID=A0A0G4NZH4_PENC3|nr:unnamed protein product [Penicillium camemberti]